MRRAPIPKALDVIFGPCTLGVNRRVMLPHLCGEQTGVVDALSARAYLLAPHKHVVRIREQWVLWRRHGIGWANSEWELIECVEIRLVLSEYKFTK
jgi:hypothetical protein